MLRKLAIKNINSIDICEIDFTKGNYKFAERNIKGDIVNPIAIYGHNGSGKTAVLSAMSQFISLMCYPVENLAHFIVNQFSYEQYKKGKKKDINLIKGSVYLEFDIKNNQYEYFLETTIQGKISKEYLKVNQEVYFTRDDLKYQYHQETMSLDNYLLVPLLRVLASTEISDEKIQVVYSYISSFTYVDLPHISRGSFVTSRRFMNINMYDLMVSKSNEVKELLSDYDNFPKYSIIKNNVLTANGTMVVPQYDIVLEDGDFKKALPLKMISTGMLNQSALLSILVSLPKESVIFIDEADFSLHPSAIKSFLKVIQEKEIQIVMTMHNTNTLQELRPDQVYFAKWKKGYSHYYRLSKIYPNIREINNIEKMYLSSIFDDAIEENE